MNTNQFQRRLKNEHGIEIRNKKGTGHKIAFNPLNGKWTDVPTHGGRREMGTKLINKILKDLGIK